MFSQLEKFYSRILLQRLSVTYEKLTRYVELNKHTNDGIGNILMENDLPRVELLSQRLSMVRSRNTLEPPWKK